MPTLAFLIPVYNKSDTIKDTIRQLVETSTEMNFDFEIVAIDDSSRDSSWTRLKEIQDFYLQKKISCIYITQNEKNLGFAQTYFRCAKACKSTFAMYVSADNDLHSDCLKRLLKEVGSVDLILQSCANEGTRPLFRRWISKGYTTALNAIHGLNLKYYNGFNIYRSDFLKIQTTFDKSFAFQAELVIRALKIYSYKEVAINCGYNDSRTSAFKIRNIAQVARFLASQLWDKKIG